MENGGSQRRDWDNGTELKSYNMKDYRFSNQKQENFEGFQSKFESEDKVLMKQIKTELD